MSEQTGALLFLGAIWVGYPLIFLVTQALWGRDAVREATARAHVVEVVDG